MENTIIKARNVFFRYTDTGTWAVENVSLDIREGEFVAILGRNGSGKSTFAKLLNALLLPNTGSIAVNGIQADNEDEAFELRRHCGMVFQNPDNQIVATLVKEDCAFGLENLGVPSKEIRQRVDAALAAVGMSEYAHTAPSMLSGGQKQRVAVAGVLAMRPKVIIFDESTAMLDPVGRRDVFNLARQLNREAGITIVWITHFMDEAALADRVVVMDSGKIALQGSPREVFSQSEKILGLGLDVPEMMKLGNELRSSGLKIEKDIMTVEEMAVALCRLK